MSQFVIKQTYKFDFNIYSHNSEWEKRSITAV